MQTFNPIYSDTHLFSDGNIEINHQVNAQSIVYLQIDINGISSSLDTPMLRGFLYQSLTDGKRSRPYPIISAKQTIKLDLTVSNSFIFVPSNRLIDYYDLNIFIAVDSSGNNQNSEPFDLSAYALQSSVIALQDSDIDQLDRLLALESATPIASSSLNLTILSANQTLESGKSYISTIADLLCTLPISPVIGDVISLVNSNNSSFKIKHGNANQTILNNTTQTIAGIDSGIILKPYSAIDLVYVDSNLWVSRNKNRQINNYSPFSLQTVASQKTYTATSDNFVRRENTLIPSIYNGVKQPTGSFPTDGVLHGANSLNLLITTSEPIILDSFNMFVGQGNSGLNTPSEYTVTALTVYRGNSASGVNLGTFTFTNSTGVEQARNIVNSEVGNTYFMVVTGSGGQVGILELELFGRGAGGGEVTVS